MFLQTQVMPEINYVKDSVSAVLRFQLKKSENLMLPLKLKLESKDSNYLESEEYIIDIKVMQHLVKQRNEIAGQLRTVTL